tara:strand:+ start:40 stop:492 length:453 start_codon:yes stop_codon:yes gene_type:complete
MWQDILKNEPQETGIYYSPQGWVNTNEGFLSKVWENIKLAGLLNKGQSHNESGWFDVGLKYVGKTILFKNEYQDDNHRQQARGIAGKFGLTGELDNEHTTLIRSIDGLKQDNTKEYAMALFDKNAAQTYLNKLQQQSQQPAKKKRFWGKN